MPDLKSLLFAVYPIALGVFLVMLIQSSTRKALAWASSSTAVATGAVAVLGLNGWIFWLIWGPWFFIATAWAAHVFFTSRKRAAKMQPDQDAIAS